MPTLYLHNSMTRQRELFAPIDPGHVRMYVCGPTVYDLAHIGNARGMTVFDVLSRLLRHLYPRVTYVRNITDVDDKINARAAASGEPIDAVTARTSAEFHADMAAIGNLPPDVEPRATGHIPEMVAIMERLIAAGHAYAAEGHVLFAVASYAEYGKLSGRAPDELVAGARVEVAPYKRDPGDFVLWKPSAPDEPGWDSPWGRGRPGWHIECSAMSWHYLGETFDIHGGGNDLLFPHHENERAQSLCAFPGSGFARVWLHNGMLMVGREKMSKSLGNFSTIRDVLARAPAEAVRLMLLRAHYRSPLDFAEQALEQALSEIDRFYRALDHIPAHDIRSNEVPERVMTALCDDLNTPRVIYEMHELATKANAGDLDAASGLRASGRLLGILQKDPKNWAHGEGESAWILEAIQQRDAARTARDYVLADKIRGDLLKKNIVLEDTPKGTTWHISKSISVEPGAGSITVTGSPPEVNIVQAERGDRDQRKIRPNREHGGK